MKRILKNFNLYCLSFLFLAAMNACQNDDMVSIDTQEQESNSESITVVISDGLHSNWSEGDPIMLVHNGQTIIVEAQESGSSSILSGSIKGTFTDANPLFGIYPADNGVSSDYESLTVTIPATQTGNENGYDEKSVVAVARTTSNSLKFQTVCGGIKLNFQMSGVTGIELESVDGYALSGTVGIKWDEQKKPAVDKIENAYSIITFSAPNESGFIPGKDYYISTLPCDVYGGYRLSIYKDGLVAHHIQCISHRTSAFNRHRIINHTVFSTFHDSHLTSLFLYGHILVNHTDTSFACNGNSHWSLGYSIHCSRDERHFQFNVTRKLCGQLHRTWQNF